MKIRLLTTASEVIDACGGTAVVARKTTTPKIIRKYQHVTNWRRTGRLPPDTFLIFMAELKKVRCTTRPSLFGIEEPSRARAS